MSTVVLIQLAMAYEIAQEFDCVPDEEQYEEVQTFYGEFDKQVLRLYSGLRPDEIARHLAKEILKEKS